MKAMKKILLFWMLCWMVGMVQAQKHDYIWVMGYNYSGATPATEGTMLDFKQVPVDISPQPLLFEMEQSVAMISDAEGTLQFYTNGCKIANAAHALMENGDEINPGEVHDIQCPPGPYGSYTAGFQSSLILPKPGSDSEYYLLHKGIIYSSDNGFTVYTNRLYYTLVDMALNNGLGRVTQKNQILFADTLTFGQLTAVRHANGVDWWIMDSEYLSDKYYVWLLTAEGITGPLEQIIGNATIKAGSGSGQAGFSPDGTKYARYTPKDDLFLFDFDRTTGQLSNFRFIPIIEEEEWVGGLAFSPSSRFLYVASYNFIYQFDTWADDIAASRIVVAEYDGYVSPFATTFKIIQLGPDCRLYVFCNSCDVIHVIQHPDEPGLACQVEQHAIELPYPVFRSMPTFPNFRLGPVGEEGLPCEPVVSVREVPVALAPMIAVWPNPTSGQVNIAGYVSGTAAVLLMRDGLGRSVFHQKLEVAGGQVQARLDVSLLPPGMYYWSVYGGGKVQASGKLVVLGRP